MGPVVLLLDSDVVANWKVECPPILQGPRGRAAPSMYITSRGAIMPICFPEFPPLASPEAGPTRARDPHARAARRAHLPMRGGRAKQPRYDTPGRQNAASRPAQPACRRRAPYSLLTLQQHHHHR